jgi:hypothetical protein
MTVEYWLGQLSDGQIREAAIEESKRQGGLLNKASNVSEAIMHGFDWNLSGEPWKWIDAFNEASKQESEYYNKNKHKIK